MTNGAPDTVMLLAAGLGTRMRPVSLAMPKPLIPVGGKALIDWCLDLAIAAGLTRAVVNSHYLADQVARHFTAEQRVTVLISDESKRLLDTGGGVVAALPLIGPRPFFVMGTDAVIVDRDIGSFDLLRRAWHDDTVDCVMLLHPRATAQGFDGAGDFSLQADGRVSRRGTAATAPFVYAGIYMMHPRALAGDRAEPFSMNRVWDRLIAQDRLRGVVHDGHWFHVGTPDAIAPTSATLLALGIMS